MICSCRDCRTISEYIIITVYVPLRRKTVWASRCTVLYVPNPPWCQHIPHFINYSPIMDSTSTAALQRVPLCFCCGATLFLLWCVHLYIAALLFSAWWLFFVHRNFYWLDMWLQIFKSKQRIFYTTVKIIWRCWKLSDCFSEPDPKYSCKMVLLPVNLFIFRRVISAWLFCLVFNSSVNHPFNCKFLFLNL